VRLEAAGSAAGSSRLYLALSIFDSFDSRDPTTEAERLGPTLSIGWH
jgi:hypothetical protein